MTGREVVIAGGGPTGLMLAAELKLAGIDVLVVEGRADPALHGGGAGGRHPPPPAGLGPRWGCSTNGASPTGSSRRGGHPRPSATGGRPSTSATSRLATTTSSPCGRR